MSDDEPVLPILCDFVGKRLVKGGAAGLDGSTPLLQGGLVDSMALILIVSFVEERFSVEIPPTELRTERLATLGTIAALVEELRTAR